MPQSSELRVASGNRSNQQNGSRFGWEPPETKLAEAPLPGNAIVASPAARLRDPRYFADNAVVIITTDLSDMLVYLEIQGMVLEWDWTGGAIFTASGQELDIERMEQSGEAYVYSTLGELILVEKGIPLQRVEDAFKADPHKTMERVRAKIAKPGQRRVYRQLMSLSFWFDVAAKIEQRKADKQGSSNSV